MGGQIIYRFFFLIIQFAGSILLANLLNPGAFGIVSLTIVNASLFTLVSGLGIEAIIIHKLTNSKWEFQEAHSFLIMGMFLQILLFILFETISLLLLGSTLLSNSSIEYLIPEVAYILGLVLVEKFLSILYPLHYIKAANIILLLTAFIFLCFLLFIYKFQFISLTSGIRYLATYTFLQGALLALFFYFKVKGVKLIRPTWQNIFSAIQLSVVVMVTNIVQLLAYRLDFWLIKYYHGEETVGVFAQANKMANLLWVLPNIIALTLLPRFSKISEEDFALLAKILLWLNFIVCFLAVGATTVLFYTIIDKEYFSGLLAYYLMIPGYFFWSIVIYYGAYIAWKGEFKRNLLASTLCLVLILVLDILLIPKLSLNGAAIANSLAYTIILLFYFQTVKLGPKISFKEVLFINKIEIKQFQILLRG